MLQTVGTFNKPVLAQVARPASLQYSGPSRASFLDRQDVSEIGGAVVGGVFGYSIGSSLGSFAGAPGAVLLGAGGAYLLGNWGHGAGLKTAACMVGGSVLLGHLGGMVHPMLGMVGNIAGWYIGGKVAAKLGTHA